MARVTSISSLGWAHYTLYEAFPRIAEMGFKRVEMASFFSYCFHFNYGSPTAKELRRMLDEHGLTPVCLNYCGDMYEAWRPEECARYISDMTRKIRQAAEAGIPMLTMSGFGCRNKRKDVKRQLANGVRVWDRLGKVGAKYGVRMLLEVPHLYHIFSNTDRVLWIYDQLDSPNVGALVDTTHWHAIGYDIDEFLAGLGDRLWHVHLRDAARDKNSHDGTGFHLELTPGRGKADFRKFGQALDKVGYAGDVSLEFEYRDVELGKIEHEFKFGMAHLARTGWTLPPSVRARL